MNLPVSTSSRTLYTEWGESLRPGIVACVGRNYVSHAREMGNSLPENPIFFLKPPSALLPGGGEVVLPDVGRVDHEVELGVVVSSTLKDASPSEAAEAILGFCVFVDLTARDLQSEAKRRGLPWSVSKGFDGFAPVSIVVSPEGVDIKKGLDMGLEVNGIERQRGNTGDMVFSLDILLSRLSKIMSLERGDLVATGTPAGVGPVKRGDRVSAWIEDVGDVVFTVR